VHTVVQATATAAASRWAGPPVGLLFHDAEHSAKAVARDIYLGKGLVAPGGVVVLHDAGNPQMGVVEGAKQVLDNQAWAWKTRQLFRWGRAPLRRGVLIVRKRPLP
jgi:hypothetical protein